MVKGTFEWEMRGQKYKDTDDTDSTDDFKKHFAYICAYTYAWKVIKPLSHLSPLFLINIELIYEC